MKIALNTSTGLFDVLGLSLDQMKLIAEGLTIEKKYLAAREEQLQEDRTIDKTVCGDTAAALKDAIGQYLKTL